MTKGTIYFDEPMRNHTTFGIGGPASCFVYPESYAELKNLLQYAHESNTRVFIVGSGSNLLVSDRGYDGIIISLAKTFKSLAIADTGRITCESGVMTGTLVKQAMNAGVSGLESLIGVPGTVGGAIKMNAGAYGKEISEFLTSVKVISITGVEKIYSRSQLQFSYRKSSIAKDEIIVEASLDCVKGDPLEILRNRNMASGSRKANQPLKYRSAGSIFKNPGEGMAAGYLIDQAGLKGTRSGGAEISSKHANFIVNHGDATAEDVVNLIKLAQDKVRSQFDIDLELEVELLGFTEEITKAVRNEE